MAKLIETISEKYTRGEYCLITHIVITCIIFFIVALIFVIHLYVTAHSTQNAFKISSSPSQLFIQSDSVEYMPIGVVYLAVSPDELLCNSVLLRRRWSIAPAHCVYMHLLQDLAPVRNSWRIAYANNYSSYDVLFDKPTESRIRRAIVHPEFLMSDYRNDIALLEHNTVVLDETFEYVFPTYIPQTDGVLKHNSALMSIVSTNGLFEDNKDWTETILKYLVAPFSISECKELLEAIVRLRSYEFCVTFTSVKNVTVHHGAAFVVNSKILGFFAWGDKQSSGVPFVILHIPFFQYWLESVIDAISIDDDDY